MLDTTIPAAPAHGIPDGTPKTADEPPARSSRDRALARLEAAQDTQAPPPCSSSLPLSIIRTELEAFDVRGEDLAPHHLGNLASSLKSAGDLDPILVMFCGDHFVVVDGHHRLEVYRQAGRETIPVENFLGTPSEALLAAGQRASKAVLPLRNEQRQNLAWGLTLTRRYSISQVATHSGISPSQVSNMRSVLRALGDEAFAISTWWQAHEKAKGSLEERGEMAKEELEAQLQASAEAISDEVYRRFGPRLQRSPELFARFLCHHMARKTAEVVTHVGWLGYGPEDEDECEF